MTRPSHDLGWIIVAIIVYAVALAVLTALQRARLVPVSQRVISILPWGILVLVAALFGVRYFDQWTLRADLEAVLPSEVSALVLTRSGRTVEVTDRAAIAGVLSRMQDLGEVMAHHGHPTDPIDVAFQFRGQQYHYRVARDSKVPSEYWVEIAALPPSTADWEIGRFESSDLEPFVAQLLGQAR